MQMFDWLNQQFSVFGIQVYWSDFLGNILALATVVLALRRLVVSWPVQIVGSVLLLIASLNVHLVGNAGRQVIIIVAASWGWATWQRSKARVGTITVSWATWRTRLLLAMAMIVGTVLIGLLLHATGSSFYPGAPLWLALADAWIFVGSVLAMVAQARRLVEFWFVWLAVDLVGVPLAISSGLYFSGLVYGIFFVLVLIGIRDWSRRSRAVITSAVEPALPVGGLAEPTVEVDRRD
ncbi:nicotinamide riboside transporter PnuC [Herbiconiux sp. A18JL235]|uniref:Nicotinamide riboside transporter PnuC n=1 Tax=Herbiconiux sp. A18JL235 TaxID=3152363 RepID=A0AB39BGA2_9MICO